MGWRRLGVTLRRRLWTSAGRRAAVRRPVAGAVVAAGAASASDTAAPAEDPFGEDCPLCRSAKEGACGAQFSAYTECVREWYAELTRARREAGGEEEGVAAQMSDEWKERYVASARAYRECCDGSPHAKALAVLLSPHLWTPEELSLFEREMDQKRAMQ